ncbi:MAG: PH domain-containing protein, partial [Chloroflexota bacterium]
DPQNLPQLELAEYHTLESKYLNLSLISNSLFWGIVLIASIILLVVGRLNEMSIWTGLPSVVMVFVMIAQWILTRKGFYKKSYAIRERDIIYKSGLIWQSTTAVPFNRVQHSAVQQGPIARYFGLATLYIYTAGGSGSDLTIPGLSLERAQQIKDFILKQSGIQHEDASTPTL